MRALCAFRNLFTRSAVPLPSGKITLSLADLSALARDLSAPLLHLIQVHIPFLLSIGTTLRAASTTSPVVLSRISRLKTRRSQLFDIVFSQARTSLGRFAKRSTAVQQQQEVIVKPLQGPAQLLQGAAP